MADISKLRLPNGSEYDLKVYTDHIAPMMSKTFQGVIGTANDFANATFYYGSIRPDDWYQTWGLKYRIKTYVPERNGYVQVADVQLYGDQGALRASSSFNSIGTSCAYYHDLYRLKIAGYNNGYGHALGVSIRSSNNPTNTEYKRTFIIDILETSNCTFTFFDECLKYSSIPGTGSTNYDTYSEINYINQGLQETGDNNDVNYQNRVYYSNPGLKAYATGGRYTLTFTKDDNYVLPITATDNKYSGEAKVYTTESFNPFGQIYYRYSSSTIAANAQIANASLYRQVMVDARYSFTGVLNGASSVMSANNPVYLVCVPQEDGSAKLAENPLSFELPDSEDGLYYILLGYAYNTYQFELLLDNPVYMFKKGRIREVSNYAHCAGDATTVNGYEPVNKAGDIMSGNLVVPAVRVANTYYGVSFGRTSATAKETLFHTGIRWIGSKHMPVIHITGFAYGLSSPVEFKIGFYIFDGQAISRGVVNMGSWAPQVYIFKRVQNENEYVSIGFKGSCYFLQLSADIQDEMGKFTGIDMSADLWSWEFLTDEGNIPEPDGGTSCAIAPYKADILNPSKVNNHTINSDVPSNAIFTDTKNTAGSTNSSKKLFLIGAETQAANPQTYSQDTAYVGTDGKLYSNNKVVLTGGSNAASSVTITPSTTDVYSMTSAGSVTAGTKNVPTKIDTSKFSGGSFTRGTFNQGTLPTLTFAMDTTDTKKLKISFSQGTLPTHAADSFTAAAIQSGFYTAGTANTPTAVTLPGRSLSAIKAWTGYTAATAAAQTFTGSSN